MGVKNGVLDEQTYKLALSIIAVTFVISPIWMNAVRRFDAVTSKHLTSLREWLAESYSPELKELDKGRAAVARSLEGIRGSVTRKVDHATKRDTKSDQSED